MVGFLKTALFSMAMFALIGFAGVGEARTVTYKVIDSDDAIIFFSNGNYNNPLISIEGRSYWLVPGKNLSTVSESLKDIVGNHQFHNQDRTQPGTAIGIIDGNKFKALVLEYMMPRSLKQD